MQNYQILEISPNNWEDAKKISKILSNFFIFRGQEKYSWPLTTTLERTAKKFNYHLQEIWGQEKDILQRFKSIAHQYLKSPPDIYDEIEWLSIIQDYGGPTRLLDFTDSFYLASFFAIEPAESDACVWAINKVQLIRRAIKKGYLKPQYGHQYSDSNILLLDLAKKFVTEKSDEENNFILCVTPSRLNERLAIQKGVFLFPCNSSNGFEGNLFKMFDLPFNSFSRKNAKAVKTISNSINTLIETIVVKIKLPRSWHSEAIRDLYAMNIDYASLFPGLDGFAKSLYLTGRVREKEIDKETNLDSLAANADIIDEL